MTELNVRDGERLYPRSAETVRAYNAHVGAEVLTWHAFRHALAYGTKSRAGGRLRIPYVRFGRRVFTSLEAISRWSRAVAESDETAKDADAHGATAVRGDKTPPSRKSRSSSERVAAAEKFLDEELG